ADIPFLRRCCGRGEQHSSCSRKQFRFHGCPCSLLSTTSGVTHDIPPPFPARTLAGCYACRPRMDQDMGCGFRDGEASAWMRVPVNLEEQDPRHHLGNRPELHVLTLVVSVYIRRNLDADVTRSAAISRGFWMKILRTPDDRF